MPETSRIGHYTLEYCRPSWLPTTYRSAERRLLRYASRPIPTAATASGGGDAAAAPTTTSLYDASEGANATWPKSAVADPADKVELSVAHAWDATFFERQKQFTPFTALYNVSGQPAVNVPLYSNADGLPIGVMLAGRMGDEGTLISLSAQLEQARPWKDRHPPLW